MAQYLKTEYNISLRRACRVVKANRSKYYYHSRKPEQAFLKKRIRELAVQYPRYGYRRIHVLMKREGWPVNVKRIYRLYQLEGLQMSRKIPKRRVSARPRVLEVVASRVNECWSMDFVSDQLFTGQKLRALTVVDHFTRQSPAVEVRFHYKSTDVKYLGESHSGLWNT